MRHEFTADISKPIFKQSVKPDIIISELNAILCKQNLKRIRRNEVSMAIKMLAEFLSPYPNVNPDEKLMEDLKAYLLNKPYTPRPSDKKPEEKEKTRQKYFNKYVALVRGLINELPNITRQILGKKQHTKSIRFGKYTPETQALFADFLKNGRKAKVVLGKFALTSSLAQATKDATINCAMLFLETINKTDFLSVTSNDIQAIYDVYRDECDSSDEEERSDYENTVNRILVNLNSLYRYMIAKGICEHNLVSHIPRPVNVNLDFIHPEMMDKLFDMKTVDWKDFYDVRDRFITVVLLFDFALRKTEASRLNEKDIRIGDYLTLNLRAEVQEKTQKRKDRSTDIPLHSYFKELMILAKAYLKLREEKNPATEALLISMEGERLGRDGCADAVMRQCKKLEILTDAGKLPSCHRLRHTFGTLMAVGYRKHNPLSTEDIQKQLRHTSSLTTERIYITNNPLLNKTKHDKYMASVYGTSGGGKPVKSTGITQLSDGDYVSEEDAIKALKVFDIQQYSLRLYASGINNFMQIDGKKRLYSLAHINQLKADYITQQEAMDMLKLEDYSVSGLKGWFKQRDVHPLKIGHSILYKLDDIRMLRNK